MYVENEVAPSLFQDGDRESEWIVQVKGLIAVCACRHIDSAITLPTSLAHDALLKTGLGLVHEREAALHGVVYVDVGVVCRVDVLV